MTTNTLEQACTTTSFETIIQQDPWQRARVFHYFDTVDTHGDRIPGLLDQTWQQVARLIDAHDALKYNSYETFLASQPDTVAYRAMREQVESHGDVFDLSLLNRLRSMCLGAAAYEDFVIIRAASEGLCPSERLGGWETNVTEMVDLYARSGLAKHIGVRIERSRLENGVIVETSIADSVAAHY